MPESLSLKDTLNLPQTNFPMRADLVNKEPQSIQKWEEQNLYTRRIQQRINSPHFVLHDGPPYTNGDIHVGTAFNKILKDILVRYKALRGYCTPLVPGWDCHGLPIEHKVSRELEAEKKSLNAVDIRKACATFSLKYRGQQRKQSQRLGLFADWQQEYATMDPAYEGSILETFASFVEGGYVYQSKKPIYWSIPCKTALAEGEVEYKEIASPAIWVKFPLDKAEALGLSASASFVIWTTTPWTLPSNLAIALHPELEYVALEHGSQQYIVAATLVDSFIAEVQIDGAIKKKSFLGKELEGTQAWHPFIKRYSRVVLADYVSSDAGTGCVHTAPGHGLDDYFCGLRYKLDAYSPIDDNGCYINDGQIPESLVGLSLLNKYGKNEANPAVIELLKEKGMLLMQKSILHAYPHCWRSKTPVIFRAMDQWFIALDHKGLRTKMMDSLNTVSWTPKSGENRMRGSLESRPDWCISRQRAWGTPLPVFYDENKNAYLDAGVIRQLAKKIAKTGTDIWFSQTAEELLTGITLPENWQGKTLQAGTDTLDVWIDSGSSHQAVLKTRKELKWPADLYLEGSDQHRGWFQSSLWTAMVTEGHAPYKQVLTHGFIVDEDRQKISKSSQKPQTADDYVKRFGADVLRLWVSSEDYQSDVPLSETILNQVTQVYRTIRNTFRFQLGNLYDFDPLHDCVAWEDLTAIDQWALYKTEELIQEVAQAYEAFAFHRAYQALNRFVTVTLSATYHDILKDRLYVSAPHWLERRSSQTAIHKILQVLLRLFSPVLVHTTDEAFSCSKRGSADTDDSIHLQDWPSLETGLLNKDLIAELDEIINLREKVHLALEPLRQAKLIGQSSDAQVRITGDPSDPIFALLLRHQHSLAEYFIVSQVSLEAINEVELKVEAMKASGVRCPRSWKWVPELVHAPGYGDVSPRSRDALQASIYS